MNNNHKARKVLLTILETLCNKEERDTFVNTIEFLNIYDNNDDDNKNYLSLNDEIIVLKNRLTKMECELAFFAIESLLTQNYSQINNLLNHHINQKRANKSNQFDALMHLDINKWISELSIKDSYRLHFFSNGQFCNIFDIEHETADKLYHIYTLAEILQYLK